MLPFVTKEYDFFTAITKKLNLNSPTFKAFAIVDVEFVTDAYAIVKTTHGNYFCETFENKAADIYMRVSSFVL
jgi:hypothetical protein